MYHSIVCNLICNYSKVRLVDYKARCMLRLVTKWNILLKSLLGFIAQQFNKQFQCEHYVVEYGCFLFWDNDHINYVASYQSSLLCKSCWSMTCQLFLVTWNQAIRVKEQNWWKGTISEDTNALAEWRIEWKSAVFFWMYNLYCGHAL